MCAYTNANHDLYFLAQFANIKPTAWERGEVVIQGGTVMHWESCMINHAQYFISSYLV